MKHTYQIQGMSCKGCLRTVKNALSDVTGVTDVAIDFENQTASVDMEQHINIATFESAVQEKNAKYHIHPLKSDGVKTRTYPIQGMTCNGCRAHVEKTLQQVDGVVDVTVDLEKAEAVIDMESIIPFETFQDALKNDGDTYTIHKAGQRPDAKVDQQKNQSKGKGTGTFYCPMHCEGDKTYDQPGDCPVCGMDLVEEQNLSITTSDQWTCPMHPEVVKDGPGDCPICGMDLVPMEPDLSAEEKTYKKLLKKFWIAVAFTLPIFIIAMSEMIASNPLYNLLNRNGGTGFNLAYLFQLSFTPRGCFYERAYRSIKTWNLNMFTLIGIGAGVAWLFSVFGMLFPDFFPNPI